MQEAMLMALYCRGVLVALVSNVRWSTDVLRARLTIDWLVLEGYGFSVQVWWFLFVFVGTSVVKGCITPHSCSVLPSNSPSKPEPQTASEVSGRIGPHEQRGQSSVSQCFELGLRSEAVFMLLVLWDAQGRY